MIETLHILHGAVIGISINSGPEDLGPKDWNPGHAMYPSYLACI